MTTAQSVPEVPASEVPDSGWLLDVREPYEWAAGHVPPATHIPLAQLNHRSAEIPKDDTVSVICRSGMRSARVVRALTEAGWQAVNVAGGMQDWAAAGRPMVSDSGAAPTVARLSPAAGTPDRASTRGRPASARTSAPSRRAR